MLTTDAPQTRPRDAGENKLRTTARLPVEFTYDMVDGRPVVRSVRIVAENDETMFLDATALFADIGDDGGKTILKDQAVRVMIAHQQGTLGD